MEMVHLYPPYLWHLKNYRAVCRCLEPYLMWNQKEASFIQEPLSFSGFSLGPESQDLLTLGPKFSSQNGISKSQTIMIKGQNYLVNMDR